MSFRSWRSLIAVVLMLVAFAAAEAQTKNTNSFSVQLGDKVVALPPPEGFEEVSSQFEAIKNHFRATDPPEGDLLGAYMSASDCELLRSGKKALYDNYAKISILREGRTREVSNDDFASLVAYVRGNKATLLKENEPRIQALFDQLAKDSATTRIEWSKPTMLGTFDQRPNVYSAMLLASPSFESGGTETKVPILAGMTLLKVKGRVLSISTYQKYHSKADVASLKQFTTKWMNALLAAN
jgi:hypothetical protein